MGNLLRVLEFGIYWSLILIPFAAGVAPGPMNGFMGCFIGFVTLKKLILRQRLFERSFVLAAFLVYFLVVCLSLVHSVSLGDSLKGGVGRLLLFAFVMFGMRDQIRDARHLRYIVYAVAAGVCFTSIDAIWQVAMGWDMVRHYPPESLLGMVRAKASFKDPNTFGIYLSAFAAFPLAFFLFYVRGKRRLLLAVACALVVAGIVLTYSRPTLLALLVILIVLGLMRGSKRLLLLLLLFLIAAPFVMPRNVKEWAKSVDYTPIRFMCNDDRISIFRNSLNMIRRHPVIGVGANTFMKNYKDYKEVPEYRNAITSDYCYAHNNFLHMAGETGLLGLGAFLLFLWALFREGARTCRSLHDPFLKVTALALISSLAAFLVNGLTESSLYYSRVALLFWFLAGALLSLDRWTA